MGKKNRFSNFTRIDSVVKILVFESRDTFLNIYASFRSCAPYAFHPKLYSFAEISGVTTGP